MERINIKEIVNKVGEEVALKGWVQRTRKMGKMAFLDLRDRSGICQVGFFQPELVAQANDLGAEYVVEIHGKVNARPEKQINKESITGSVEIEATKLTVINTAETTPFEIVDNFKAEVKEELRLKYRYLDLRRERMKKNILLRHAVIKFIREYLYAQDFIEIETPYVSKSTPEGARDFLIPSRNFPGKFYALPQSPQQYKQMLMVGGMERYFQIARCFRDEDARGDRQVEFTQLDMEMSFITQEDIMRLVEGLFTALVQKLFPEKTLTFKPFKIITYAEAMRDYGCDKPDMRKDKTNKNELAFVWVIDFPMFEQKDDGSWGAVHNPFTAVQKQDLDKLNDPSKRLEIKAQQYDLVLNGYEVAGGAIRTHDPKVLQRVFELLEHKPEEIQEQFGHLLEAFKYGVPPHGGIAPGLDRLVMLFAGENSIQDVIAFPKTTEGRDPLMDGPSTVSAKQLKELHLNIEK